MHKSSLLASTFLRRPLVILLAVVSDAKSVFSVVDCDVSWEELHECECLQVFEEDVGGFCDLNLPHPHEYNELEQCDHVPEVLEACREENIQN